MYLTFKKNNKQTKKPVNRFLQDDASAGIRSLQTSIEIKLCQEFMERTTIWSHVGQPRILFIFAPSDLLSSQRFPLV